MALQKGKVSPNGQIFANTKSWIRANIGNPWSIGFVKDLAVCSAISINLSVTTMGHKAMGARCTRRDARGEEAHEAGKVRLSNSLSQKRRAFHTNVHHGADIKEKDIPCRAGTKKIGRAGMVRGSKPKLGSEAFQSLGTRTLGAWPVWSEEARPQRGKL